MHRDDDPHHSPQRLAASPGTDDNLLFGIIALQVNFITREALVSAFDVWTQNKSRTLSEILISQGILSSEEREILETLVRKFVEKHAGDPEKSLAALSSVAVVRLDLERLNDRDLEVSLGHLNQSASLDPRLESTLLFTCSSSLGRFRILRPHAKGGLGQVSVALDQELHREVALKEIKSEYADDHVSRERFVLEAEITGGLEHPGIVPVYALGQAPDGRPFYAMRFVKGDSLKQAIEAFHNPDRPGSHDPGTRQLALRQLLGRFIDVCNAMEYAHSRGVLHRDLKPGNIMVGKYGETLVVDWGLAKSIGKKEIVSDESTLRPSSALSSSGQTRPGSAIGTPAYMSPEQALGRLDELGPASDVYSLGATLYHVLCGKPPFEKGDVGEVLKRVRRGDFPNPKSVAHEVPAALDAICLKAMAVKAADRYQTARSFADDLEHWLADEPVTASPETIGDQISRFARKHRGYVRAGTVAMILIAIVSIISAIWIDVARQTSLELAGKNQQLAIEKGKLAEEKSALVESEREAKTKAEMLAEANGKLANDEREARLATTRQLRIAKAEQFAAMSHSKRTDSPELSLLLAVESGRATRVDEEGRLANSNQALLDALSRIGGRPLIGHQDEITSVAISPNSKWIVTGSSNEMVRVWNLTADGPISNPHVLRGHEKGISSMAISGDSRWLVTASWDKTARVWDLTADNPAANPLILSGHQESINSVAISLDGRWIVTGSSDKSALVWDITANNPAANPIVLSGHQGAINCVAISSDSRWIVTGSSDMTARVWDLSADSPASNPRVLSGHQHFVNIVAISTNIRWIVTGSSFEGKARVWEFDTQKSAADPIVLGGLQHHLNRVSISPDSRWIVTESQDNTAQVWDLTSESPGVTARILRGHEGSIASVAISSDSHWVITGSNDKTARVWDLTTHDPSLNSRVLRGHQATINGIAFSSDSRWVVTGGGDKTARVWDLAAVNTTANPYFATVLGEWVSPVAISHDSRWIVTCGKDNTAQVWNLTNDNPSANSLVLSGHQELINCIAISPDGHWVITGSNDKTARVWDITSDNPSANPLVLNGDQDRINSVAISSDGHWAVTGTSFDSARVWNLTADDPSANPRFLDGHQQGISSVAISPDNRWIVTGSWVGIARVWNLTADDPIANPHVLRGHKSRIISVAISSDSRWIATGSDDKTARVWDLAADSPAANPLVLTGHLGPIVSVTISPDSRWIVTGSGDKTARVWDLTADSPAANPFVLSGYLDEIDGAAISPDSNLIVTCSFDKNARARTVRSWRWQWDSLVTLAGDVGRNFSREEWIAYFPGEPYRKTFLDRPIPGEPQTAYEYVQRGQLFLFANAVDQAIEDFSEAIRIDPQFSYAHNQLAWIRATSSEARFRDGKQAIFHATRACELTHWTSAAFIDTLAAAYSESGDFELAIKWQSKALARGSHSERRELRSHLNLYKSRKPLRDTPNAAIAPDDPTWAKSIADAAEHYKNGAFQECIKDCRVAIAIDFVDPEPRELLVKAALQLQDWPVVGEHLRVLAQDNPNAISLVTEYGCAQAANRRWAAVSKACAVGEQLDPGEILFPYLIARAQIAAGDVREYRQTCHEMFKHHGRQPTPYAAALMLETALPGNGLDSADLLFLAQIAPSTSYRGASLCRAQQFQESMNAFEFGTVGFSGQPSDWLFVSIAQNGVGNTTEALKSLKKARELIGTGESDVLLDALVNEVEGLLPLDVIQAPDD